ncbi:unnamed protein product [Prorocentrum cordatum]|uniref:Transmembrane protein 147 n=1 Tax=Prorocentrum cordatum TaxID=2364126 RepID=A0ABN9XXU4_9DINO|nr:unnamed protein product [Polarella glacialis]
MAWHQKSGFETDLHEKISGSLPRRLRASFARRGAQPGRALASGRATWPGQQPPLRTAAAATTSTAPTPTMTTTKHVVIEICPDAFARNYYHEQRSELPTLSPYYTYHNYNETAELTSLPPARGAGCPDDRCPRVRLPGPGGRLREDQEASCERTRSRGYCQEVRASAGASLGSCPGNAGARECDSQGQEADCERTRSRGYHQEVCASASAPASALAQVKARAKDAVCISGSRELGLTAVWATLSLFGPIYGVQVEGRSAMLRCSREEAATKTQKTTDGNTSWNQADEVHMAVLAVFFLFLALPDFYSVALCIISVELCDVLFAVDSIPAVFAVTDDPVVVFGSNIAAILGLRSLYQVLSVAAQDLVYLEKSVAVILGFVGVKLGLEVVGIEFSSLLSLGVILSVLGVGIGASVYEQRRTEST